MTIKSLYPSFPPSLNLDFANSKRLDSRITFTRSSTGTYFGSDGLLKSAAVNEARFDHNPATGESLGLLVEGATTNRHTYSEQFDNAAWTKYGATITANATTAPDGTTTADKFASTSGAALIAVQQTDTTLTNGASYTRSVFAKASEISSLTLQVGNTSTGTVLVQANLSAGTATNGGVVTTLANGWFRISYSYTQSGTTGDFYLTLPANTVAGSGVFIWGAQLEAGAFPTSYIATTTATVTRSADVASITGTNFSNWYNQGEGTMLVNARYFGTGSPEEYFFQIDDNSSANFIKISKFGATTFATVELASAHAFERTLASIAQGSTFKAGLAYKTNSFAATLNGASPSTSTSGAVPSSLSRLRIGNFLGSSLFAQSTIVRLTYWSVRLSDTILQELTR